jgi:hypothetical protein
MMSLLRQLHLWRLNESKQFNFHVEQKNMKEQKENQKEKKVTDSIWNGEIQDSKGRKIRLRTPTLWDEYLLCKVIGKDAENTQCLWMGEMLLKVASIDNAVMATPTSYNEFSTNIGILGHEGLNAIVAHAQSLLSPEGEKDEIKK